MHDHKPYTVGSSGAYPFEDELGWRHICEIPELVAAKWLLSALPNSPLVIGAKEQATRWGAITITNFDEIEAAITHSVANHWGNKVYYVVEAEAFLGVTALYKHDFKTWVIHINLRA